MNTDLVVKKHVSPTSYFILLLYLVRKIRTKPCRLHSIFPGCFQFLYLIVRQQTNCDYISFCFLGHVCLLSLCHQHCSRFCLTDFRSLYFFFVHTRQDTNVGNHSHVHSTNNRIYNKDGTTINDGFDIKL